MNEEPIKIWIEFEVSFGRKEKGRFYMLNMQKNEMNNLIGILIEIDQQDNKDSRFKKMIITLIQLAI